MTIKITLDSIIFSDSRPESAQFTSQDNLPFSLNTYAANST